MCSTNSYYGFALVSANQYHNQFTQVTVSKAQHPCHNGVYREEGNCNDRKVYEHASGARISFNADTNSWVITVCVVTYDVLYSKAAEDEDIVPPTGLWRSHCGHQSCTVKIADEPQIPPDILSVLQEESATDLYAGVDKAATPAERLPSTEALARDLDRARPLYLVAQRDSDANKSVSGSRAHAWDEIAELNLATSSTSFRSSCQRTCRECFIWLCLT